MDPVRGEKQGSPGPSAWKQSMRRTPSAAASAWQEVKEDDEHGLELGDGNQPHAQGRCRWILAVCNMAVQQKHRTFGSAEGMDVAI